MQKQLLIFIFLAIATTFIISCEDDTPRGFIDLKSVWNPTALPDRKVTAAMFNHEKHDDVSCKTCHGKDSGGRIELGRPINGLSVETNVAHSFCVTCHNAENAKEGKIDTPIIETPYCGSCHLNNTAPFNGGNNDLSRGVTTEKPKVIFSHDKHLVQNAVTCKSCHENPPTTVASGRINGINTKDTAHALCAKCHNTEINVERNCAKCHK